MARAAVTTGVRVQWIGALCHGRPRGPHEPHGALAPLVRTLAWGLALASALCLLGTMTAYVMDATPALVGFLGATAVSGVVTAATVRLLAAVMRPGPVTLPKETRDL